ncbi:MULTISPECIES: MOSC domain-containing protein [unclassified Pseudomonas]|uniref:MOSC domain-containing protein n=1 Tax=unclassified Pseudomonas TaxID=196821 RepID=UPI002446D086|nr:MULTISPECIES: MOSC domain-containing protein [unclassified Pseudomonas]MDH0892713.1 MOSC domain-containing protein [Pseudomonas sp. GD03875]MDH1063627.1 MOSC domain-containing protein [Pseudomonas sp. GD03985]
MQLSALYRYPLKSARGESLASSPLEALGLQGDRRWMLVEPESGRFLTQRLLPQMSQLTALYNADGGLSLSAPGFGSLEVALPHPDEGLRGVTIWRDSLRVPDAGDAAAEWLSAFIGRPCRLVQAPESRTRQVDTAYAQPGDRVAFPDGFPLLLIGQASLDDLSARVGRPLEMLRFRPNLVVEGSAPYAEDEWKRIRIGDLEFEVAKGCSRCILTTIDPGTGVRNADREPLTTLKTYRERNGEVYFGQNLLPRGTGELRVGMSVKVLE